MRTAPRELKEAYKAAIVRSQVAPPSFEDFLERGQRFADDLDERLRASGEQWLTGNCDGAV